MEQVRNTAVLIEFHYSLKVLGPGNKIAILT